MKESRPLATIIAEMREYAAELARCGYKGVPNAITVWADELEQSPPQRATE